MLDRKYSHTQLLSLAVFFVIVQSHAYFLSNLCGGYATSRKHAVFSRVALNDNVFFTRNKNIWLKVLTFETKVIE
jgi:hypothetical protein